MVVTVLAGLPLESRPGGANRVIQGESGAVLRWETEPGWCLEQLSEGLSPWRPGRTMLSGIAFCMCDSPHSPLAMREGTPVADVGLRHHQVQLPPLSLRHVERGSSEKRRVSKLKGLAAKASVG